LNYYNNYVERKLEYC